MDKDLYDMAYEINRLVSDQNIKIKSQAVMNAVNAVVLHERHVNAYADVHGITIYHISKARKKIRITPITDQRWILPCKQAGMSFWMRMQQ